MPPTEVLRAVLVALISVPLIVCIIFLATLFSPPSSVNALPDTDGNNQCSAGVPYVLVVAVAACAAVAAGATAASAGNADTKS